MCRGQYLEMCWWKRDWLFGLDLKRKWQLWSHRISDSEIRDSRWIGSYYSCFGFSTAAASHSFRSNFENWFANSQQRLYLDKIHSRSPWVCFSNMKWALRAMYDKKQATKAEMRCASQNPLEFRDTTFRISIYWMWPTNPLFCINATKNSFPKMTLVFEDEN